MMNELNETPTIKIMIAGACSGVGKTTILQVLDPDANLLHEQKRSLTAEEMRDWKLDMDEGFKPFITTSTFPNFGNFIVYLDQKTGKYTIDQEKSGYPVQGSVVTMVFDTPGQKIFFPYREAGASGAWGILFVIDASRDLETHKMEVLNGYVELHEFFKEGNRYGPVSKKNPMLPPTVILANKQDIVQKWKIEQGGKGREVFYQTILGSFDKFFKTVPFVGTCAVTTFDERTQKPVKPWGVENAVDLLFKEIVKRQKAVRPKDYIPWGH
jgi:signal recognition particle receptor subunit beta